MSTENPDRIEVPQIPGPDTNGSEWVHTGISREMPLPVQLSPEQIIERQRAGRVARKAINIRLSKATKANAATADELKNAKVAKKDVDAKCAILDQEVETERTMRDGTVEILHRYPVAGGMPTEILIRRDDGYEGMRHGSERELPAEEWVAQSSIPGTVTEPTAKANDVIRAAIEVARVELSEIGAEVSADALLKFVRAKVPGLAVDDATIGAHCLSILIEHAVTQLCEVVEQSAESLAAAVDVAGADEEMARAIIDQMVSDGILYVSDGVVMLAGGDEPEVEEKPASAADAEIDDTATYDNQVMESLRTLAPKLVAKGPDASAGKVAKKLQALTGNKWDHGDVFESLKRLKASGRAHQVPKTRSFQAISIV